MGKASRAGKLLGAAAAGAVLLLASSEAQAKPNWSLGYSEMNSGNAMFGLAAADASNAWAVGVSSSNGNSQPVGVRTMDGAQWFPMTLPPVTGGMMTMYLLVAFQDAQVGWMHGINIKLAGVTGYVWRTQDGGSSWNPVFQSVTTLDQLQALPDGAVFGAGESVVLVSKDGMQFAEVPVPVPSGMEMNGIAMLNSNCGFAVAGAASDSGTMGAAVLWTGDGGQTWAVRGESREFQANRGWFVSPTLGWLAGEQNGRAIIARTTDGGNAWTPVAMPDHPPVIGQDPSPATSCVDVKFFDDQRGVATCLACTSDCEGGEGSNPSYLTVFVRSEDGGQTWVMDPDYEAAMAAPPFPNMSKFSGMLAMAFPDPNTGFLAGQNNLILRYTAASPEPAGWGPSGCDPGSSGAGGGSPGAGGAGAGASSNGAGSSPESDSGCGCRAAGSSAPAGIAFLSVAALAVLAARRRR